MYIKGLYDYEFMYFVLHLGLEARLCCFCVRGVFTEFDTTKKMKVLVVA
jgi:hypothetical protein